jgi:ATP phosphoribosyltransferase regulatory subunit HisZ
MLRRNSTLRTEGSSWYLFRESNCKIGAEIYGHSGAEADIEILSLMLDVLQAAEVGTITFRS